jgi:hypothetical protein
VSAQTQALFFEGALVSVDQPPQSRSLRLFAETEHLSYPTSPQKCIVCFMISFQSVQVVSSRAQYRSSGSIVVSNTFCCVMVVLPLSRSCRSTPIMWRDDSSVCRRDDAVFASSPAPHLSFVSFAASTRPLTLPRSPSTPLRTRNRVRQIWRRSASLLLVPLNMNRPCFGPTHDFKGPVSTPLSYVVPEHSRVVQSLGVPQVNHARSHSAVLPTQTSPLVLAELCNHSHYLGIVSTT